MNIFKITSEYKAHFESAYSLLNQVLGDGLYSRDTLRKTADDQGSILLGCLVDDRFVGVAMSGKLKESGIGFYARFGEGALDLLRGNVVGVLRNSAVVSQYRGRGVGASLLSERLQWLAKIGCDHAVGLTWLHGKTHQSDRLYKAAGFQQIGPVVPEFFKSLSESTGMHCPYCGFPCRCSAAMFSKEI